MFNRLLRALPGVRTRFLSGGFFDRFIVRILLSGGFEHRVFRFLQVNVLRLRLSLICRNLFFRGRRQQFTERKVEPFIGIRHPLLVWLLLLALLRSDSQAHGSVTQTFQFANLFNRTGFRVKSGTRSPVQILTKDSFQESERAFVFKDFSCFAVCNVVRFAGISVVDVVSKCDKIVTECNLPYLWDGAKDPGEAYLIGDFVCLFAVQPRWMDHFLLDRALKKGEITKAEYDKEVQPFLSGKAVFTYPYLLSCFWHPRLLGGEILPVPDKVYAIEYSPASKNEPYHCCWLPGCHQNYGVLPEPVTRKSVWQPF